MEFLASDECEGRASGTPGGLLARRYVTDKLDGLGVRPAGVDGFHQLIPTIGGANIVGLIPAQRTDASYIVLGAHYDHLGVYFDTIHRGADDNASGVAVLLDVSKSLLELQSELGCNVLVISFDSEEPPHFYEKTMGSIFFVDHPTIPLDVVHLMINLDLIGHAIGNPDAPPNLRNTVLVSGAERGGLHAMVDQYRSDDLSLRRLGANVKLPSSDHHAFQNAGISSIFFNTGRDRHYHTPQDTAEKLDYRKMLTLSDALTELIVSASKCPPIRYDPNATDDATTMETIRFLADHQPEPTPHTTRALEVLGRLSEKHSNGSALAPSDHVMLTRLLELFEKGLA